MTIVVISNYSESESLKYAKKIAEIGLGKSAKNKDRLLNFFEKFNGFSFSVFYIL